MTNAGRQATDAEIYPTIPARDRDALAKFLCDVCLAKLMTFEVGMHFRTQHPTEAPRVVPRIGL